MIKTKIRQIARATVEEHVDRWLADLAVSVPSYSEAKTPTSEAWRSYRDWIDARCTETTNAATRRLLEKAKCEAIFIAVMRGRFQVISTPLPHYGGLLLIR